MIREVRIPYDLAKKLESLRLTIPKHIVDRNVHYKSHYAVTGGQSFSKSFSQASKATLSWSNGAHGLRHSYAQKRMDTIRAMGKSYNAALEIVSQELGHFRPSITEVYLR